MFFREPDYEKLYPHQLNSQSHRNANQCKHYRLTTYPQKLPALHMEVQVCQDCIIPTPKKCYPFPVGKKKGLNQNKCLIHMEM